jgi:hypothetical protein
MKSIAVTLLLLLFALNSNANEIDKLKTIQDLKQFLEKVDSIGKQMPFLMTAQLAFSR